MCVFMKFMQIDARHSTPNIRVMATLINCSNPNKHATFYFFRFRQTNVYVCVKLEGVWNPRRCVEDRKMRTEKFNIQVEVLTVKASSFNIYIMQLTLTLTCEKCFNATVRKWVAECHKAFTKVVESLRVNTKFKEILINCHNIS